MLCAAIILCPLYSVPASHVIPQLALPVSDLTLECRQLDWEAASWRSQAFAPSTKATYTSHLRCFLKFGAQYRLCPCPADDNTIVRYASSLARSKCYGSVVQYLNIIRIIHQEFGLPVPSQDNWYLSTVLRGIKRGKGHRPTPKAHILPQHLHMIYHQLRLHLLPDLQFWAATLTAFFGLLRIGNITWPNSVLRSDIILTSQGIILTIRNSKTTQFCERTHEVVLPYISNNHLCPVTTLLKFLSKVTNCPLDAPLFATCKQWQAPSLQLPSGGSWGQSLRPAPSSHTAPHIPSAKGVQHGCCKPEFRWQLYVLLGTGPVMQFTTICYLTLTLNLKWFLKPLTRLFH